MAARRARRPDPRCRPLGPAPLPVRRHQRGCRRCPEYPAGPGDGDGDPKRETGCGSHVQRLVAGVGRRRRRAGRDRGDAARERPARRRVARLPRQDRRECRSGAPPARAGSSRRGPAAPLPAPGEARAPSQGDRRHRGHREVRRDRGGRRRSPRGAARPRARDLPDRSRRTWRSRGPTRVRDRCAASGRSDRPLDRPLLAHDRGGALLLRARGDPDRRQARRDRSAGDRRPRPRRRPDRPQHC